ncbi:Gp49 family protein [Acinetobacter sp. YH12039]|uniref:Gp49 family protein n=1 Tax=Acinetobacter sp. YH12039 TaxID=2601047 RepID=UPI00211F078F|nr:Gp49 family protein [Acinetobacter sp. YH12039]
MNKRVVCKENGLQALAQPMSYENFAFHEGFKCPPGHETNKGYLVKYEEDELLTHKKWFSESEFNQLFTLEVENTEQQIEQEIQSKNLNAPRLTSDHIDSKIKGIYYSNPLQGVSPETAMDEGTYQNLRCLTFCTIVLENGFTVTGESACVSPENFDAEIGRKIAYENARNKIWMLEGYLLKEKLYQQPVHEVLKGDASNVKSFEPEYDNQVHSVGGDCIHRSKLLNNRENAYLLTQLLTTTNISNDLREKAETKMTALLDELI